MKKEKGKKIWKVQKCGKEKSPEQPPHPGGDRCATQHVFLASVSFLKTRADTSLKGQVCGFTTAGIQSLKPLFMLMPV